MSEIASDITKLLLRELEGFKREIDLFPDEDSMWRSAPGVTNSAANLALHVSCRWDISPPAGFFPGCADE
jgi:hypothetical protein